MADRKIKKKISAQVSLEFTMAFVALLIFLSAAAKIFVWFGNSIVQRHQGYEISRTAAGVGNTTNSSISFYNQTELHIFR